jgi:hypothetical protein
MKGGALFSHRMGNMFDVYDEEPLLVIELTDEEISHSRLCHCNITSV